MKVSAVSLKGLDWKKFLVNHGEKIALGGIILFGLMILASSRWSTFKKDPQEFITQADNSKVEYLRGSWPDEERSKFADQRDISDEAKAVLSPVDEQKVAFIGSLSSFWEPVIPPQKPAEEPQWYPVQRLVANSGTGIFAVAPPLDPQLVAADGSGSMPGDSSLAGTVNGGKANSTGLGVDDVLPTSRGRMNGETGMGMEGSGMISGSGMTAGMGRTPMSRGEDMGSMGSEGMMGGESGYGGTMAVEGEPRRYVAVRGVFPLKQELMELERALNMQSINEATSALIFTDFQLERQRAVSGPNPWTGDWEAVDVEVALDMLNKTQVDIDEVDPAVTERVFTMPLPARVPGVGQWGDKATHPSLSEYLLTDEAKKKQEWLQNRLADFAAQQEALKKVTLKQGGFSDTVYDAQSTLRAAGNDSVLMGPVEHGGLTEWLERYQADSGRYQENGDGQRELPAVSLH